MPFNLLARLAKFAALFGLFLPWVAVSCSGNEIARATGVQLMTGDVQFSGAFESAQAQAHADPVYAVILVAVVIGIGLLAGLLLRGRAASIALLAGANAGLAACLYAIHDMRAGVAAQAAKGQSGDDFGLTHAIADAIVVYELPGYWVTVASLGVAALLSAVALFSPASGSPPNSQNPG